MSRYRNRGCRRRPNALFSVFLIVAGILLFLANLNLLPISVHQVWQLWPLILVGVGLSGIFSRKSPRSFLFGGLLAVFGVIFTLVSLGIVPVHIHDDSWPLSMLFLALGIGGLARVMDGGSRRGSGPDFAAEGTGSSAQPFVPDSYHDFAPDLNPLLDNYTVMGSINRKLESQNFQGGKLTCILGSIEVDLRRARMPEGAKSARLDANAVMGSIKLRVPESWRVVWTGDNVMGAFEDKTIPPNTGLAAPELIVSGSSVMGTIEIES